MRRSGFTAAVGALPVRHRPRRRQRPYARNTWKSPRSSPPQALCWRSCGPQRRLTRSGVSGGDFRCAPEVLHPPQRCFVQGPAPRDARAHHLAPCLCGALTQIQLRGAQAAFLSVVPLGVSHESARSMTKEVIAVGPSTSFRGSRAARAPGSAPSRWFPATPGGVMSARPTLATAATSTRRGAKVARLSPSRTRRDTSRPRIVPRT